LSLAYGRNLLYTTVQYHAGRGEVGSKARWLIESSTKYVYHVTEKMVAISWKMGKPEPFIIAGHRH
jgi:hypothetical protein